MRFLRQVMVITAKDLRAEMRTKEAINASIAFAIVILLILSFAFDPSEETTREISGGLLWIVFTFAGTLVLNVALSLALLKPLGTGGLALANGLASLAGLMGVLLRLRPRLPGMNLGPLLNASVRALGACLLMGLLAWEGARFLSLDTPHSFHRLSLGLRLLPLVAICAATYGIAAAVFGHPEARELTGRLRRKR